VVAAAGDSDGSRGGMVVMVKIGKSTMPEGVNNPRFGARENGAELGTLNFSYPMFGAREDGTELATSDSLGPLPSGSALRSYGADMHYFDADRGGAKRRG
jgi:hypothetical protein